MVVDVLSLSDISVYILSEIVSHNITMPFVVMILWHVIAFINIFTLQHCTHLY